MSLVGELLYIVKPYDSNMVTKNSIIFGYSEFYSFLFYLFHFGVSLLFHETEPVDFPNSCEVFDTPEDQINTKNLQDTRHV